MPLYQVPVSDVDISSQAIILDTNVLVSAFLPEDERHADARAFLDLLADRNQLPVVPLVVIVETWGVLVGRRGRIERAIEFVTWLNNPGNAILLPQHCNQMAEIRRLTSTLRIDFVDAMLVRIATEISESCAIKPPLRIATFDTRDFRNLIGRRDVRMRLHDLTTSDDWDVSWSA
jgi:predicted nucleic acid-binding protein